jgi:hypothetical protein
MTMYTSLYYFHNYFSTVFLSYGSYGQGPLRRWSMAGGARP